MPSASPNELRLIAEALNLSRVEKTQTVQSLWSGYGELYRICSPERPSESFIVKSVKLPKHSSHPRGWSGERGHDRKVKSYHVESHWYGHYGPSFVAKCPMPRAHLLEEQDDGFILVLSDLDGQGYTQRPSSLQDESLEPYLRWLANFHVLGLGSTCDGLWDPGSYWHLATRPDELEAIADIRLKNAAGPIDRRLRQARHQTIIHGDAKLANFCVMPQSDKVAMVDFQYVGRGVGVQDLAYFLSSALSPQGCAAREKEALSIYFDALKEALEAFAPSVDHQSLIHEWTSLYTWAWADFVRFLAGWAPSHYKLDRYSLELTQEVLIEIEKASPGY